MPTPIVVATTGGFSHAIKTAFGDAIDTAVAIVLGIIQGVIVLTPIVILLGPPGWIILRIVRRRFQFGKQTSVVPEA
jgi:hypothetical protein